MAWLAPAAGLAGTDGAPDYDIAPTEIAAGVYLVAGAQAPIGPENGAAIANSGFIIGSEAVLVIDPGPTALFAEQLLESIAALTPLPVRWAVVTHHHPDHAFGVDVMIARGISVVMHPAAAEGLARDGEILLGFMADLAGDQWTRGTRIRVPDGDLTAPRDVDLGGRRVRVTPLTGGHSPGDLIVEDLDSATLFAGDLVFVGRAATVPHADLPTWFRHLERLRAMTWTRLVPGHGPVITETAPIDRMEAYLAYIEQLAKDSWQRGDSVVEVLMEPVPPDFADLVDVEMERQRSLMRLFERYEAEPPSP